MSRYVLFLTFALLLAGTGFAQFKISGKVVNDQGQPVGFSEVVLFQNGSDKVAAGAATKDDGSFALQAPQGAYRLQVRIFGQAAFEKTLDLAADTDLGTISINDKTALEEVTVTDQKKLIERKVDRVVFNVENSVLSTGSDALEALKRTPRILVKDKGLEMIGKGAIVVMMDDRLLRLSGDELILFLKSLRTDQIKSIYNPPFKT